jgi:KaiC/GvpD/RAD55 family RecA-like ATPase
MSGANRGEPGLYITISETKDELAAVADSHGWDLSKFLIRLRNAGYLHDPTIAARQRKKTKATP